MKRMGLSLALLGLLAAAASAAELGSAAAPLAISTWVKGEKFDLASAKGKNIVVVEFWATWCPPCRTSIPHLTEMQKRFADQGVVFVGVTDEEIGTVKPFVEKMGDKMDYRVAIDADGQTAKGYMEAFGQGGIPHAFIVGKDGNVIWHGHPMMGMDRTLEQVIAGKYDIESAKKADKARALLPEYAKAVTSAGDAAAAAKLGAEIVDLASNSSDVLNEFAWFVLTNPRIVQRDLPLALKAAEQANKASGGTDPNVLDTYAMAQFKNGKKDDAIATQKKAIELEKDEAARKALEERLAQFESGKVEP